MMIRLIKFLDATLGVFLCWMGGRLLYLMHREAASGELRAEEVRRVLVIRPGGLGDMILLQPMLKKLHEQYPQASIDLICERRNEAILRLSKVPVNVFAYDARPFRLLRRLVAGGYDVAIDSEQFHYFSAVMVFASRAPIRIGYKINPGRNPVYTHLITYDLEGYEADEFMKLLGPLGVFASAEVFGSLAPAEVSLPDEYGLLWDKLQRGSSRLILVHVGVSMRYKAWPLSSFAGLVRGLCGDGAVVGLVGGHDDEAFANNVVEQCGKSDQVVVLAGHLTISQTAKFISKSVLFAGGDSGLAHLAAAFGVPTVVLFGPSDANKWCKPGDTVAVVQKKMACSPCFIFGYHKYCRTIACMGQIGVEEVLEACRKVMVAAPRSKI